ncbi:hypothetical protein SCHPADRAFT_688400 [Schizopora paradoxa]|uniref:Uncharacterized protein n=1 Tax=Schizopora paradoxa TaxID=27342 RepID=A0A0H2R3V7_9AGAM|nr:hypothetical protein SCHPADRAFT_688400 [Schizopora paradoxa]
MLSPSYTFRIIATRRLRIRMYKRESQIRDESKRERIRGPYDRRHGARDRTSYREESNRIEVLDVSFLRAFSHQRVTGPTSTKILWIAEGKLEADGPWLVHGSRCTGVRARCLPLRKTQIPQRVLRPACARNGIQSFYEVCYIAHEHVTCTFRRLRSTN